MRSIRHAFASSVGIAFVLMCLTSAPPAASETRLQQPTVAAVLDTEAPPAVMTNSGPVQGVQDEGLTIYKGMPFAAPPVDALRWQAPQPVSPWKIVKTLDHFGPNCMQKGMYPADAPVGAVSEDCLYLNLWVPPHSADQKLPVMVWIYGGGLDNGSGSIPLYHGDVLARHGVIVVTFNYRLGVFGFLALPELAKESLSHASGNYGLLDQIAALRWVHDNIAAFGGDPSHVTVFGQSSGSISISALSVSPLTKDLFRYAIGESGALMEPMQLAGNLTAKGAQDDGQAFMRHAGASSLAMLRGMSAKALMGVPFTPGIILDGNVINEAPTQAYQAGRINPSAFMFGSNHDEGVIFLIGKHVTPENYDEILGHDFPSWLVKLIAPTPGSSAKSAYDAAERFESDMRFHWDMWAWARRASEAGRPVYLYQFDHPTRCLAEEGCTEATRHGDEMPFVFGHDLRHTWTQQDRELSDSLVTCWTQFAKTGSPAGCGLSPWAAFGVKADQMVLGTDPHLTSLHPDSTLSRLDRFYSFATTIDAHPIVAVIAALAILIAILIILTKLVAFSIRRIQRRRRHPIA